LTDEYTEDKKSEIWASKGFSAGFVPWGMYPGFEDTVRIMPKPSSGSDASGCFGGFNESFLPLSSCLGFLASLASFVGTEGFSVKSLFGMLGGPSTPFGLIAISFALLDLELEHPILNNNPNLIIYLGWKIRRKLSGCPVVNWL